MNALENLLSPFDTNQFFLEYWQRRPLHIPGSGDKFASFPGLKELPSLLIGKVSGPRWTRHTHNAQASLIDRNGKVRSMNAVPSMWPDLFNAGVSLCFSALDQTHEELTKFVQGIAATTPLPGKIVTTCYLTPPASGSGMHFDSQHVFFMQVAGQKHWKVSRRTAWQDAPTNLYHSSLNSAAMKESLDAIGATVASPEETGLDEITLNTGDALYMPPGFWHEGRTSDSHSLHYTLTFMPLAPWHLLAAYLRRSFFENPCMRRDLRYAAQSGDGDVTKMLECAIAELRKSVDRLTPAELEQFFVQVNASDGPLKNYLIQA
jgi:ribosomal protein L16 Arg81 hydroxylase